MKMLSASALFVALVAVSSVSQPVHATAICDQQFQQCIDDGIYPIYKCEDLRTLCEDVYGMRSSKVDPADKKEIAQVGSNGTVSTEPQNAAP